MKYSFSLFVLLLIGVSAFGQDKPRNIPTYKDGSFTLWYTWSQKEAQKMGLSNLTENKDSLHYRLWMNYVIAVDIYITDDAKLSGHIGFSTTGISKSKKQNPKEYNYNLLEAINDTAALQIYNYIQNHKVADIPPQDSISGWWQGNDGDEYLIEVSTPTLYQLKDYWTPGAFPAIKEAVQVDSLFKYLERVLNLSQRQWQFISALPRNTGYTMGNMSVMSI